MKKFTAAFAAAITAVALSACSKDSPESTPTVTVTSAPQETVPGGPPPPPMSSDSEEEIFIDVVRGEIDYLGGSDQDLINLGYEICESFDYGESFSDVTIVIMDNAGVAPYDAGFIIGASVGAFCPEHEDAVTLEEEGAEYGQVFSEQRV